MMGTSETLWHRLGTSRWLTNRRQRRRWVIGTYVGWLVIAAVVRLADMASPSWDRTVILILLANSTAQLLWLGRRTYMSSPTFGDAEPDERLVQIKNQAFRKAYQVFTIAAGIAVLVIAWAITAQPGEQGFADWFVILCGLMLLATTLPTTIVAWREPDLADA
jgi:uncharacterized membrane protein